MALLPGLGRMQHLFILPCTGVVDAATWSWLLNDPFDTVDQGAQEAGPSDLRTEQSKATASFSLAWPVIMEVMQHHVLCTPVSAAHVDPCMLTLAC